MFETDGGGGGSRRRRRRGRRQGGQIGRTHKKCTGPEMLDHFGKSRLVCVEAKEEDGSVGGGENSKKRAERRAPLSPHIWFQHPKASL